MRPVVWTPVVEVPGFIRASSDRFFVAVDADAPDFDEGRAETILQGQGAIAITAFGLPEWETRP